MAKSDGKLVPHVEVHLEPFGVLWDPMGHHLEVFGVLWGTIFIHFEVLKAPVDTQRGSLGPHGTHVKVWNGL